MKQKDIKKLDEEQKIINKKLLTNGFKLKRFVEDKEDKQAYCPKCKQNRKIKKAFIALHKNNVLFISGKCKICKTECFKSIKE